MIIISILGALYGVISGVIATASTLYTYTCSTYDISNFGLACLFIIVLLLWPIIFVVGGVVTIIDWIGDRRK